MSLLETTQETLVEACKERKGQRKELTISKRRLSYLFIERGKRNHKLHKTEQHNERQTKLYLQVKEESHEKAKSMNRKTVHRTASFIDHYPKQQLINMPF